ncbi:BCS1 N terminal-domain-containing protein [Bombardia bombarda]|uniref:BCS1 N terminal-domain-containing protein n=1 Tax=Bombardia bombarda TaxID=252184 RepID=A0AA39X8C3_9PEZI|nr:BCS1 N terminal-domain-containing protein [Bombardia bombarda]
MEATAIPSPDGGIGSSLLSNGSGAPTIPAAPQMMLLDFFFPGFSVFSTAVMRYLHVDLNVYIPLVLLCGGLIFAWRYFSEYIWNLTETYLMSVVDIRTDDEIYNMLMAWVASQRFAQGARRFVVNTNLNSRSWFLWRWEDEDEDEDDWSNSSIALSKKNKKALAYTPTFGSHWFWYRGRVLIFRRTQNREQGGFLTPSEREEISISCFGRNPWLLKELLHEARLTYMKRDEAKTLIYRGTTKSGSTEPTWQRCMARTSRPFSTVILNEKVKKDLIDDVTDYLNPATRRWYSNRGIPYRRGYLLYGPPGTGKSSLSLALAGFFKMRIYIVSLSSVSSSEENLATLFAGLPRRCVVLLEDIDTAGLTHTREGESTTTAVDSASAAMEPGQKTPGVVNNNNTGRLSLSGLLNILDGVASQEGRVLIMTTNHLEKLDKALIRPGRVDMIVKFDRADAGMTAAIFRAIFAPLEGDDTPVTAEAAAAAAAAAAVVRSKMSSEMRKAAAEAEAKKAAEDEAEAARKKDEIIAKVGKLAEEFAAKIPAGEFSPAEIQGFLLKNKRDPDAATAGADKWVEDTRREKKERESKRGKKSKKGKKSDGDDDDSSSSSSSDSSDSDSDSEGEVEKKKKKVKKVKKAKKTAEKEESAVVVVATLEAVPAVDEIKAETKTPVAIPAIKADAAEAAANVDGTDAVAEALKSPDSDVATHDIAKREGRDSGYGTPTTVVFASDVRAADVVA